MTPYEVRNMLLGMPKSIFLNIKLFGFKGIVRLPILVSPKTHIKNVKRGDINVTSMSFGSVKIGINLGPYSRGVGKHTFISVNGGSIVFKGKANIAADSVVNVSGGGCIFGQNFSANNRFVCSCEKHIEFGQNVLFGWNCTVIDGDGHKVINADNGEILNSAQEIVIGDHVWIASNSVITKGALLLPNSIVGEGTLVNSKFKDSNILVGGRPAKILKKDVNWIR